MFDRKGKYFPKFRLGFTRRIWIEECAKPNEMKILAATNFSYKSANRIMIESHLCLNQGCNSQPGVF